MTRDWFVIGIAPVAGRRGRLLLKPLIEPEWNRQLLTLISRVRPHLVYSRNADLCYRKDARIDSRVGRPRDVLLTMMSWKDRPGSRFSECVDLFDLVADHASVARSRAAGRGSEGRLGVRFGFEPSVHRPIVSEPDDASYYGSDAALVATYEGQRGQDLGACVTAADFRLSLWGNL